MKIIHVADIHANRERKDETVRVIKTIKEAVEDNDIKAVLFCGDFWDSTITNTSASGFIEIIRAMHDLIKTTQVVMIYGTPSHEPDGSLDIFKEFGADVFSELKYVTYKNFAILAIPEPRLGHIEGVSLDEKYRKFHSAIHDISEAPINLRSKLIVMYHGDIEGARLQNGTDIPSGGFALSKSELKNLKADYIACGHIHEPQKVVENCYYSGSACPKDFGETHDAIFKIVEL